MKIPARQLFLVALLAGCSETAPRALLKTASGSRPLDSFYGIYYEPVEGGVTDVEVLVLFADPGWGCSADAASPDAVSFAFVMRGATGVSIAVFSRSGPTFGATSGGSGEVRLNKVDDRYQGDGPTGPMVGEGGHVEGHIHYELSADLLIDGDFRAPHCALIDFRNAV